MSPPACFRKGPCSPWAGFAPAATPADRLAALLHAQRHLHALGITAWQDAIVGTFLGMEDPSEAYLTAARDGSLTARVVGALWWDRARGAEQIPELVERRAALKHGRFRATSVKLMLDGVAENGTASLLDPYLDKCGCATANRGKSFIDPARLPYYVSELDALGFQCHFHALGDGAVRHALDAVEAARKANGPSDTRPHLAHLQVVHPDDVPRFAALGATANIQPLWAAHEPQMDELTIPFLGPERASWQYPFGSLLRSGARLAAGSDWPVSSPDPLQGIHVAVNRVSPDEPGPVFLAGRTHRSDCRVDGVHRGNGVREPPRRHRERTGGCPRGSRRPGPRPVRGTTGSAQGDGSRAHLRRRGARVRGAGRLSRQTAVTSWTVVQL